MNRRIGLASGWVSQHSISRADLIGTAEHCFPESNEHQNNFLLAADFKRDWIHFPTNRIVRGTAVWAGVRTSVCGGQPGVVEISAAGFGGGTGIRDESA